MLAWKIAETGQPPLSTLGRLAAPQTRANFSIVENHHSDMEPLAIGWKAQVSQEQGVKDPAVAASGGPGKNTVQMLPVGVPVSHSSLRKVKWIFRVSSVSGRRNLFLRKVIAATKPTGDLISLTRQGNPKMSLKDETLSLSRCPGGKCHTTPMSAGSDQDTVVF